MQTIPNIQEQKWTFPIFTNQWSNKYCNKHMNINIMQIKNYKMKT